MYANKYTYSLLKNNSIGKIHVVTLHLTITQGYQPSGDTNPKIYEVYDRVNRVLIDPSP